MARKEDADCDGLQRTSSFDPRSCGNVWKIQPLHLHSITVAPIQPLHLHSITVGPILIAPSEVLQAGFVLRLYQLSARALAPTESVVFIVSY